MNPLDFFIQSCFPGGPDKNSDPSGIDASLSTDVAGAITTLSQKQSTTQPRFGAYSSRHPTNRGGMVVDEIGNVSIRSGNDSYDHSIGSSISLTDKGKVLITAPQGLGISGGALAISGKPSQMFNFLGGRFQFNPVWEDTGYTLTPIGDLTNVFVIQMINGEPLPVPILSVFNATPLFTKVGS